MLRGGSLFYALAITVIMGLVSSSLLLAAYYNRLHLQRDEIREEVIRNSASGLELIMDEEFITNYNSSSDLDLFGNGTDSVLLETKPWGAFEIAIATAHNKSTHHTRIAAIGWKCDANDKTALTLADLDRPLSITGNTKLTGDCYLPKAGIQRAYIEGQNYAGDKMVYGNIKTAERFIPKYNDTLVQRIKNLFEFKPANEDSIISIALFAAADSIQNSFSNKILYVFSPGVIQIDHQNITGQVCIISPTSIRVGKNSSIHNALLIAPYIEIENETQGDFQAFARDSLHVGEKVHLHYPTFLGIIATARSPLLATMSIGEKTHIMGQLFACSMQNDFRKHVLITTAKESIVYGEIYSTDLLDHKGTVYGEVSCTKFQLKTPSAEYENHLMNAVINRPRRSPEYVASALTRKRTDRKAIIQALQ